MRNPTTGDFGTDLQKFLIRINWPFFWPAAGLDPEPITIYPRTASTASHPEELETSFIVISKGIEPYKEYSGKFNLRIPLELHAFIQVLFNF